MKIASHVEGTKAAIYVDGIAEGMTQEQLEEAIRQALEVQSAGGPWISADEELPEVSTKPVLVRYANGEADLLAAGRVHVHVRPEKYKGEVPDWFKVTHWAEVRV